MKKDSDGNVINFTRLSDHLGADDATPQDIAKEIRARVEDLNELIELAFKRNVHVSLEITEADDDDEFESLEAIISQRL